MTIKFTTTEFEHNNKVDDIILLFEFLDDEVPEMITFHEKTKMGINEFIGSLQTHQIQGTYLQPIILKGMFKGTKIKSNGTRITAKERSDQLGRLQARPIKFFYEGIKQIVIIEDYKINIHNYQKVDYELVLRPHDIQEIINPQNSQTIQEQSISFDIIKNLSKGKNLTKATKSNLDKNADDINKGLGDLLNNTANFGNITSKARKQSSNINARRKEGEELTNRASKLLSSGRRNSLGID